MNVLLFYEITVPLTIGSGTFLKWAFFSVAFEVAQSLAPHVSRSCSVKLIIMLYCSCFNTVQDITLPQKAAVLRCKKRALVCYYYNGMATNNGATIYECYYYNGMATNNGATIYECYYYMA